MSAFHTPDIDLGHGVAVEFRFHDGRIDALWSPDVPSPRLMRRLLPAYVAARGRFLTAVAHRLDAQITVIDMPVESEVAHGR